MVNMLETPKPMTMQDLLLEGPKNFKSEKEYNQFLKQFKKTSNMKVGYFFSFDYDFYTHYPIETLRYLDYRPVSLIFNTWGNNFLGVNFHAIPILTRRWFLARIKSTNPRAFQIKNQKLNITWATLKGLLRKSGVAIRQYRPNAASNIKLITNDKIGELLMFQVPSFYSATFPEVVKRYKNFVP